MARPRSDILSPMNKKRKLPERTARVVLGFLGGVVAVGVRQPVIALLLFGTVTTGSGGVATQVNGALRIVLLVICAMAALISGIVVWRSRARLRITELELENRALKTRLLKNQELRELQDKELVEKDERIKAQQESLAMHNRRAAYWRVEQDVAIGLRAALQHEEVAHSGMVRFIENNSLRPLNEKIAAELQSDHQKPAVEVAIAQQTPFGFRVTHASGMYTARMKDEGECFTGEQDIRRVVARKAAAHFHRDGWHVCRLAGAEPTQYLFLLANVPLQQPERDALIQHANNITLTMTALAKIGVPQ
jgi:hypothetical protein